MATRVFIGFLLNQLLVIANFTASNQATGAGRLRFVTISKSHESLVRMESRLWPEATAMVKILSMLNRP